MVAAVHSMPNTRASTKHRSHAPLAISALLARLATTSGYAHPAGEIVRLETHISHVFVARRYAYITEKAGGFGFLDFTTP